MIWLALLFAAFAVGMFVFRRVVDRELRTVMNVAMPVVFGVAILLIVFSTVAIVPAGHVEFQWCSVKCRIATSVKDCISSIHSLLLCR